MIPSVHWAGESSERGRLFLRKTLKKRIYKNVSERAFQVWAEAQGWTITKRGWPDFFCVNHEGKIVLVEVKTTNKRLLRQHQYTILTRLAAFGIPCYRWSPQDGFRWMG